MDLSQKTLGAKIAALRKIRNMTQEQLAAQLGISAPAVSKWETGQLLPGYHVTGSAGPGARNQS